MSLGFIFGVGAMSILQDNSHLITTQVIFGFIGISALLMTMCRRCVLFVIAFIIGIIYFIAWTSFILQAPTPPEERITIEGVVTFQESYVDKQRLTIHPDLPEFIQDSKVLVYARRYPEYDIGSSISATGQINAPEPIEDFRFDRYLERNRVDYTMFYPQIRIKEESQGLYHVMNSIRGVYYNFYAQNFHEPVSSFYRALVMRMTREIPDKVRDSFAQSGISHILAISGLHIGVIMFVLNELLIILRFFPIPRALTVFGVTFFYLIIIGFPASAVRASIMGIILLMGYSIGRPYHGLHTLLITAAIMVAINPMILIYDIGFQLSFAALTGIITTFEYWKKLFFFIPNFFALRSSVSLTMSAQIFTWPLLIYYFGIVSIIAPIMNAIVVPILAVLLLLGFVAPALGLIPIVFSIVKWPMYFIALSIIKLSEYASLLPYSYIYLKVPAWIMFSIYIIMLVLWFLFIKLKKHAHA